MPVHKVGSMWRYGTHGKKYKTKAAAERQGRAIRASQAREEEKKKKKRKK